MKKNNVRSRVWLTTDTHLGHVKAIEYGRIKDFEKKVLNGLSKHIKENDVLIHLGDVSFTNHEEWNNKLMASLPASAKKILVRGNHDKKSNTWYLEHGWDFICRDFTDKFFGLKILFSHRPTDIMADLAFNIHGHSHGNAHRDEEHCDFYDKDFHLEIAIENTNYQPVLLKTLLEAK